MSKVDLFPVATRFLVACLGALAILVLFVSYVFLIGPWQDRRSSASAQAFCKSVPLGEGVSSVRSRAKAAGIALEQWTGESQSGFTRYVAVFSGSLTSAHACWVVLQNGVVFSVVAEKFE